uniref:uncharacterized protein LOC109969720 isoform X2 n=1 Tax=Monopterus albus TaxID=43700 RepID=UPI0009B324F3|nr:uncharacterized protein LOC109969720 isoform X2 [Monopterus albus]
MSLQLYCLCLQYPLTVLIVIVGEIYQLINVVSFGSWFFMALATLGMLIHRPLEHRDKLCSHTDWSPSLLFDCPPLPSAPQMATHLQLLQLTGTAPSRSGSTGSPDILNTPKTSWFLLTESVVTS